MKDVRLGANLKSEQHHWWPKSLSKYWNRPDGKTTRLTSDGQQLDQEASKFGSIGNAHHVDLNGPWTHTYEPLFNKADSYFSQLVLELLQLDSRHDFDNRDYRERFSDGLTLTPESEKNLPECLASLVVRSPNFRNIIKNSVNYFGMYRGGVSDRHEIVAMNIGPSFEFVIISIKNSGLKFILFSDHDEFIFGDGFLHNISAGGFSTHRARLLLPLLPEIAIACVSPIDPYRKGLRTIRLTRSEVASVNFATQVYSSRFIFFRSQKPEIHNEFTRGEFRQFKYHKHELLEKLASPFIWATPFSIR